MNQPVLPKNLKDSFGLPSQPGIIFCFSTVVCILCCCARACRSAKYIYQLTGQCQLIASLSSSFWWLFVLLCYHLPFGHSGIILFVYLIDKKALHLSSENYFLNIDYFLILEHKRIQAALQSQNHALWAVHPQKHKLTADACNAPVFCTEPLTMIKQKSKIMFRE